MNFNARTPYFILGIVLLWRVCLLVFTAQPIPADDAAFFDGAMANWYLHGHYFNPGLSVAFPISGHQLYAAYPPGYQLALLVWMKLFGTSVLSAMGLHVALFCVSSLLVVYTVRKFFPAGANYAVAVLLLFAVTFDDRPEGLAHDFGLLALLLTVRAMSTAEGWGMALTITAALFCALYTSVITGALYFGVAFIAVAVQWLRRRDYFLFVPFILTMVLFVVVTFCIACFEPLWWAGFRENARQTPVLALGFRMPQPLEVIKLVRTAPVFLVAVGCLPFLWSRRKQILAAADAWIPLVAGVFVMGWILLIADMTLLAANYVMYVLYIQIFLAAGLLALAAHFPAAFRRGLAVILAACVLLVSVRAIGMTIWGALCAGKNSYAGTHEVLQTQLAPFTTNNTPVIVSSAYVYTALEMGAKNPVQAIWFFDRANWTNSADLNGLVALQPAKLLITQYDYYRTFEPLLQKLEALPGVVTVQVHDLAKVRTPDSIPSLQRVVQHISWAPVIVDLDWK